jgi:hypothetical protein
LSGPFQYGPPGQFRERLTYEEILKKQVDVVREAFNVGDPVSVMNSVEALQLLLTRRMVDEEFLANLQGLDDAWQKELKTKKKEYERATYEARRGCPDLVEKPSTKPGLDHWKRVFVVCISLMERKGLGLRIETEEAL